MKQGFKRMPKHECDKAIADFDTLLGQMKTINAELAEAPPEDPIDTQAINIRLAERALRHGG